MKITTDPKAHTIVIELPENWLTPPDGFKIKPERYIQFQQDRLKELVGKHVLFAMGHPDPFAAATEAA